MTTPTPSAAAAGIPRIFVSHSHHDNAFCRPFVAHLRTALSLADPEHIFYDESSLHAGDAWLDRIQREVIARPIFLVILTPHAVNADYVGIETRLAIRETVAHKDTRLLIPLLAEECDPNHLAPVLLDYQIADFVHQRYDTSFEELVACLRTRSTPPVETGGRPLNAPTRPPADPWADLVARLLPGIHAAYEREHWHVVLDKAGYLASEVPAASVPAEVYRMLGEARYETGDFAGGRAALETALARDATDVATLRLAGRACLHSADPTAAEAYLKKALALSEDATERLALLTDYAEALIRLKQWPELLRRTDDALRFAPDSAHWLDLRLQALLESGQDSDALVLLRTLTARPDAPVRWWLEHARLARRVIEDDDEVRMALAGAEAIVPWNDPRIAQARRELLLPPLTPEQVPAHLASLGFVSRQSKDPQTGKLASFIIPPTVNVPAGEFQYGEGAAARTITLPAFRIARYPITVAEYACFVRSGWREPTRWQDQLQSKLDHPVVSVSWHDAVAYAAWLARLCGQPWRLPSEKEWEKAACWDPRGGKSFVYPWGDTFDAARCNTAESHIGMTTPVGTYGTSGTSPCGAEDLAGNIWEWTNSFYDSATQERVLRGGSWSDNSQLARADCRGYDDPSLVVGYLGFRLALAPMSAGA